MKLAFRIDTHYPPNSVTMSRYKSELAQFSEYFLRIAHRVSVKTK